MVQRLAVHPDNPHRARRAMRRCSCLRACWTRLTIASPVGRW